MWHFTPSLPPQSVIDNWSNVWQMAMHIILVLPQNMLKRCRLCHAETLPWMFSVHCEMNHNKETTSKKNTSSAYYYFFFVIVFLHAQCGWPVWIYNVELEQVPVTAYLAPSTWPSKAYRYLRWINCSCMPAPPAFLLRVVRARAMTCDTFFKWRFALICDRSSAMGRWSRMFFLFFVFIFYCRSHNESGPLEPLPPSPTWKFFRLSVLCKLLRWPVCVFVCLFYIKVKGKSIGGQTGKDCLLTWAGGVKVIDRWDQIGDLSIRKHCIYNHLHHARDPTHVLSFYRPSSNKRKLFFLQGSLQFTTGAAKKQNGSRSTIASESYMKKTQESSLVAEISDIE